MAFERTKRLGIFAVQYITPDSTFNDSKKGASITSAYARAGVLHTRDESILELHLRNDMPLEGVGPEKVRESLGLVAAYARLNADVMQPDEVVGITDSSLGRVAKRFGFEVHDISTTAMPPRIAAGIDKSTGRVHTARKTEGVDVRPKSEFVQMAYHKSSDATFGHLVVAHQTMPEFLQQFGDASEHEAVHVPPEVA